MTGIILLGGSVEAEKSLSRGMLIANEAAERVLGTIALAHLYPQARILISSGSGSLLQKRPAEAPMIANYFKTIGIDPARVMIEDRSRTTFENAVFSRALANPKPGERWLLVTSAWHMPRSVGVFRKAGFDVTAYPVDYRTGGTWSATRRSSPPSRKACAVSMLARRNGPAWSPIISPATYRCASACPSGLADRSAGRLP